MRLSDFNKLRDSALSLWDESALRSQTSLSKLQKFAHFWIMVVQSFNRNRLPVRAASLAYVTLLALIPMLAVVVSVTSSFLKNEGEERINNMIVRFVSSVTPPAMLGTNVVSSSTNIVVTVTNSPVNPTRPADEAESTNVAVTTRQDQGTNRTETVVGPDADRGTNVSQVVMTIGGTNEVVVPKFLQDEDAIQARKTVAKNINQFIQNTRSGALGVTGSVLLIFTAIALLGRIEATFNDIWGVLRGRNFLTQLVLYWGVLTLVPLLLVVAIGLASGPHLESTRRFLDMMPFISTLVFNLLPLAVLCLTFAVIYKLMPNTYVSWRAALMGGLFAGALLHLNNLFSVFYVSRVVSNSKIYGSLGLVPVFMMGLYFAWMILLLGAQVSYAFQNRATYVEEKQVENINQRGREFIALRLMTLIGSRFLNGDPPPGIAEMSNALAVPSRLVREVMRTLAAARLVVEAAGPEPAFSPARPLDDITCHDILLAMRATHGQELATRDGPVRAEVLGEFHRIQEAERKAASSVTVMQLALRSQPQIADA